jgi:hypothetical protein
MTIVGTRPELIKMSRVIERLDRHDDHVLVHTGQNYDYELNQVFFEDLGIRKPDHFLEAAGGSRSIPSPRHHRVRRCLRAGEARRGADLRGHQFGPCRASPRSGARSRSSTWRPAIAASTSACRRRLNRKVIDHLSDINMTLTEHARRYLLAEGLPPERTFKVGSHMPRCWTISATGSPPPTFSSACSLRPTGRSSSSAPIARRTSTARSGSPPCSTASTGWPPNTAGR